MEEKLRTHGLRATPQRVAVMEALLAEDHPDAETIFAHTRKQQQSMSLATVYHVLEKFEEAGLVSRLEMSGRRLYDGRTVPHDHVRCRACGRIEDVLRHPETQVMAPRGHGWRLTAPSLTWDGVCPDCQEVWHG
nr:Fur family transcriptional regulator [Sulfobacillus harzensis]